MKTKDMSENSGTAYGEIFEKVPYDVNKLSAELVSLLRANKKWGHVYIQYDDPFAVEVSRIKETIGCSSVERSMDNRRGVQVAPTVYIFFHWRCPDIWKIIEALPVDLGYKGGYSKSSSGRLRIASLFIGAVCVKSLGFPLSGPRGLSAYQKREQRTIISARELSLFD